MTKTRIAPIALETRGLAKSMDGRPVLKGIDLRLEAGEAVAVLGANGAGKTTLLKCLATELRPTAGQVFWLGEPAGRRPADRRRIGVVAHESFLYADLTAAENLLFAGRMYGVDRPRARASQWLRRAKLQRWSGQLAGRLSRGMRQRLAIARALVHDPPLLLLDEPFDGLDVESGRWLEELFGDLRGRTICFTSHDAQRSRRLADRVLYLDAGRLRGTAGLERRGQAVGRILSRSA